MRRRGPKSQSGALSIQRKAASSAGRTLEIGRKHCLQVRWLNGPKGLRTQETLFKCCSSLPEVEQEELHQPRLRIRTEDLLEPIEAPWALVLQHRWRKTSMTLDKLLISLIKCE